MNYTEGGVTAPIGYRASGIHAGIRKNKAKKDLALIISDCPATAAAVYTQNLVKGAPLLKTKEHLKNGIAQAVICNSGNANTCNADGMEVADAMCVLTAKAAGIEKENVIVASTGVIGQPLDITPIAAGMQELVDKLGKDSTGAAEAIMTTDTLLKMTAVRFTLDGKDCTVGGIAKGSGMIHPNMATMLVFITTDAAISGKLLSKALSEDVKTSFNMVSVDGDTSTNDMVTILANGRCGNDEIVEEGEEYRLFCEALHAVTSYLCRLIAKDGEGATKLLIAKVDGAKDDKNARLIAKSIITSSLFKAAMFGEDANWGRVLCAIGYSGARANVGGIGVSFQSKNGSVEVCRAGSGLDFDESTAKRVLTESEITVLVTLTDGKGSATAWGCDLSYDYVKINGDYRT